MKFLKADGTIEEGTLLTDEQARLRDVLEEYIHSRVCRHSYHGTYDSPRCREVANFLTMVVGVNDSADKGVADAIFSELENLKPKAEDAHPSPVPTGVEA